MTTEMDKLNALVDDQLRAAMIAKFKDMTPEQICDEVVILVNKATMSAIKATEELMRKKVQEAIDQVVKENLT